MTLRVRSSRDKAVLSEDVYPGITTVGCLVSMMDCARQAGVKPYYWKMSASESGRTKGWACGVAEKGSDWLGSSTGPHTKEVWTGKIRPDVQQGFDLLWEK